MLTIKQEKFVQNLIQGMSQREAYKNSYNAAKMKDNTIDNKASELFKKGEVRARYDELVKQLEDNAIMSASDRMKWLTKIINDTVKEKKVIIYDNGEKHTYEESADLSTKIRALDTLNKMSGEYKTILDGSVEVKKKLEDLL